MSLKYLFISILFFAIRTPAAEPELKCRINSAPPKKESERLTCGPTTASLEEQMENLIKISEEKKSQEKQNIPDSFVENVFQYDMREGSRDPGKSLQEINKDLENLKKKQEWLKKKIEIIAELKSNYGEKIENLKNETSTYIKNNPMMGSFWNGEDKEKYQEYLKKAAELYHLKIEAYQKLPVEPDSFSSEGDSSSSDVGGGTYKKKKYAIAGGYWAGGGMGALEGKGGFDSLKDATEEQLKEVESQIKVNSEKIPPLEKAVKARNDDLQQLSQGGEAKEKLLQKTRKEIQDKVARIKSQKSFKDCGLSDSELYVISTYAVSGYNTLNQILIGKDPQETQKYDFMISALNSGLSKLAPYDGFVRRAATLSGKDLEAYCAGCEVRMSAFTSSTVKSGFTQGQRFVIKSKTGAYIGPLSMSPQDGEVLFKNDTKFKVLAQEGNIYFMEEVGEENISP